MSDENKTKLVPFKLPKWFRDGLADAQKATDTREKRTAAHIVVNAVCKVEKFKKPKGFKFRKPS